MTNAKRMAALAAKLHGLRSAGTKQNSRGRYPCQHRMDGPTNLGNGNQRCTPQDCIQIQIQSQQQGGFHPQVPPNPYHSRRVARSQESEGARGLADMVIHLMKRLQQLVQQQPAPYYQSDSFEESANAATTTNRQGPAPKRERCKQKEKLRRHNRRSPFKYRSPSPPV